MRDKSNRNLLNILLELGKFRITVAVTITSFVGFLLANGELDYKLIPLFFGILFLASGASALNHIQEKATDALMERAMLRPLPSGRIGYAGALLFAVLMATSGLFALYFWLGFIPFLLGCASLFWYNAIYTPLKKISALAVVPGSLIGSLPPAIGWTAAGGSLLDPAILYFGFALFIWQIPHFWILLLVYDKEYRNAGFPTLTQTFREDQLKRITYVWIIALVVICTMMPLFGLQNHLLSGVIVFFAGLWLTWTSKSILKEFSERKNFRTAFTNINLYILIFLIVLSIDSIIGA